jgi:hypothetical protein
LDLSATDDQPNVDNNTTEDSQSQHKGKSPMDRRFNQDKSKDGGRGGGRGNSKGRDRKSKNSDRSNNSDETFETQNKRTGRAPSTQQTPVSSENTPSKAESLRKLNPFGALDESSSEEED